MSKFDFSALEAAAVSNNYSKGSSRTPIYALSVEEAREHVKIKDGNKVAKEDGSVALTLTLGKYVMSLDAIKPKATRINAEAGQVEAFTATLQEAIDGGAFDEAIIEAQAKGEAAANTVKEAPASEEQEAPASEEQEAPEGLDLDAIGGEEEGELE